MRPQTIEDCERIFSGIKDEQEKIDWLKKSLCLCETFPSSKRDEAKTNWLKEKLRELGILDFSLACREGCALFKI